jgi:predicted nucleic acid-binding protein
VIFDSDVLIAVSRGDYDAGVLVDSDVNRFVSIVSVIEVLQGAKSRQEMERFRSYLRESDFEILGLSAAVGDLAIALIEDHSLTTGIELGDALIAATALETGHAPATGNIRHFRSIPRLRLQAFRPHRH